MAASSPPTSCSRSSACLTRPGGLGLRRWKYTRRQSHAQRNSTEAIKQRKRLRSARALDSKASKRGEPAYNAHHDPVLGAPKQRRKFDLEAAKEKMAGYDATSSSSKPSPRPREGYSGARDVRCVLCAEAAGAGGAGPATAAAPVGGGADADEAPAAGASGKRSRGLLLVGCFFCRSVVCLRHATPGGDARIYPPGVSFFGKEKYRRGAWWCDECNTAMQLPVEYWSPEEQSQEHAEKVAKVATAAKRKAAKTGRAGNKEARQQGPSDE